MDKVCEVTSTIKNSIGGNEKDEEEDDGSKDKKETKGVVSKVDHTGCLIKVFDKERFHTSTEE